MAFSGLIWRSSRFCRIFAGTNSSPGLWSIFTSLISVNHPQSTFHSSISSGTSGWHHRNFSTNSRVFAKNPTSRSLAHLRRQSDPTNNRAGYDADVDDELLHHSATSNFLSIPGGPQRLFLVQLKPKHVVGKKPITTVQLMFEENKTLVETLGWQVVDSIILNVMAYGGREIFGSGNTEKLISAIKSAPDISGIFFGWNVLLPQQVEHFQKKFQLPLYDRYRIVLEIFRQHAKTREAKLQVALAELPFVRSVIYGAHQDSSSSSSATTVSGSGSTKSEMQRQLVIEREKKLNDAISAVRASRSLLRKNRVKNQVNTIAIVGYTNAGKTSLIKTLTNDASLVPENKLFATLDVTSHEGVLPSNIKVLYMDTIGFISDIPPTLIASFGAVLEEVALADVIVHVRDVSHPDAKAQKVAVLEQLRALDVPAKLMDNIIEVCNKSDRIGSDWSPEAIDVDSKAILTSALAGTGMYELRERVEKVLFDTTGLLEKVIRVPQSGEELRWLYKDAHVLKVECDPDDAEYLMVHVTISEPDFARFVHKFRKVAVRNR